MSLEVQHPSQSEDVVIVPAPVDTYLDNAGLAYSTITAANLVAGDTFDLSIAYRRNTSELSAPSPISELSEQPVDVSSPAAQGETNTLYYGLYALAGAGVMFLLFFWREMSLRSRLQAESQARPSPGGTHPRARRGKRGSGKGKSGPVKSALAPRAALAEQGVLFCHHCGIALREDADFCHACGTRRRDS